MAGNKMTRKPKTFRELIHLRRTKRDPHDKSADKISDARTLERLGYSTPAIYEIFDSADEVTFGSLPKEFVIKPHFMASKRGVHILHKISGEQGYWDSLYQKRVWKQQIRNTFADLEDKWRRTRKGPFRIIAEERIAGEHRPSRIPLDYKFYTFNGVVRLILQIDRNTNPPTFCFYDREFTPIETSRYLTLNEQKGTLGEPVIPSFHKDMLALASKLSIDLQTPFVSIDMYASTRGPIIGELTYRPGGPYFGSLFKFTPEFEKDLAREWFAAANALGIDVPLIGDDEEIPHRPWAKR